MPCKFAETISSWSLLTRCCNLTTRPPIVRIKDAQIGFESLPDMESDDMDDPMRVSWEDLDRGGASEHESSVATSGASIPSYE